MSLVKFFKERSRKLLLFLIDIISFTVIDAVFWVVSNTVDKSLKYSTKDYIINSLILLAVLLISRTLLRAYNNIWRYSNTFAYLKIVFADFVGGVVSLIILAFLPFYHGIWHIVTVTSLTALATLSSRFCYRIIYKKQNSSHKKPHINVAIVGAGQIGVLLANELICNPNSVYSPKFFIDSDRVKVGSKIVGLPVFYEDEAVIEHIIAYNVSEIFIALPTLESEAARKMYDFYSKIGCKVKIYDTPIKDAEKPHESHKRTIREFHIEDLLFRNPLSINDSSTVTHYTGKTVLVTGGGGSIGSELCRQVAKCRPKKLIILDIYENNAYDIQQELVLGYGDKLDLAVEIASVRDRTRLEDIFSAYRPDIVFHAAAHKHVPLMEHSAGEAIKNNVMGTYNTADMAEKYGAERFILISTDKAVNPTNVMGASKRICEMIIQCRYDSKTSFAAVRFGNVLGSNGSVIPLFKRQIASGGPITITDKRIIRYFMTISEASQLVMQAGAMAKKGEIFVLDMGKAVRIYDLAVNMIKLSGLVPDVDIKIEEIGLRPGEKLYEELLMKTETLDKTDNNMIFIEKDTPFTRSQVDKKLELLCAAVETVTVENARDVIKNVIKEVVPTFHEPSELNKTAESSDEMKELAKV